MSIDGIGTHAGAVQAAAPSRIQHQPVANRVLPNHQVANRVEVQAAANRVQPGAKSANRVNLAA